MKVSGMDDDDDDVRKSDDKSAAWVYRLKVLLGGRVPLGGPPGLARARVRRDARERRAMEEKWVTR